MADMLLYSSSMGEPRMTWICSYESNDEEPLGLRTKAQGRDRLCTVRTWLSAYLEAALGIQCLQARSFLLTTKGTCSVLTQSST